MEGYVVKLCTEIHVTCDNCHCSVQLCAMEDGRLGRSSATIPSRKHLLMISSAINKRSLLKSFLVTMEHVDDFLLDRTLL